MYCTRGIKLFGDGGYFLKGIMARLNLALMIYDMNFLEGGYKEMYVPHFINSDVMEKLCNCKI